MTVFELLQKAKGVAPVAQAPAPAKPQPKPAAPPAPPQSATLPGPVDISEKAMLVSFNVSIPGNEKVDRDLTKKVQESERMGAQSGKWDKTIFPPALYKPITQLASAARAWHYSVTLPWPIKGSTILPLANHQAYCAGVRDWKAKLNAARDVFTSQLPTIRKWAQSEHNGSYDSNLYLEDKIKAKFGVEVNILPMPADSQFAASIRAIVGVDSASVSELVARATQEAEAHLWNRIIEPLRNLQTVLTKKEHGDRTRITESLLASIVELADLIPALNITGDPRLDQFAQDARAAFSQFSQEDLSDSKAHRKEAINRANEILKRLSGISGVRP